MKQRLFSWIPSRWRERLPAWRWEATTFLKDLPRVAAEMGFRAAVVHFLAALVGGTTKTRRLLWSLPVRGFQTSIAYRAGSTDFMVVRQVFGRGDYSCVDDVPRVRTILDCGANIGATAVYFLERHPKAQVAIVEPDPDNLRACRRNLARFGSRIQTFATGVWSCDAPVIVERGLYRDGGEWAFQIRPVREGEKADFRAATIGTLLDQAGFDRVDILKMDVEAAEEEIFRTGADLWLPRVGTLVIELHDDGCVRSVEAALAGYEFTRETSGELTVYRDLRPKAGE